LRRVVRCASPPVAQRVCARVAASGRGRRRAQEQDHRRAIVFALRWCEVAVAPCRVSSADHDVDDRCRDHDDDSTSDHDDDSTTADDDHDDSATATADHHDDDHCTTAARADEQ
jgi:Mg-chelatase subunit ChlI